MVQRYYFRFAVMKKVALLLMFLQIITFALQPTGTPASLTYQEMYQQCSQEDHDITPLDFVFEHILNFECIINLLEGESKEEHQPYQSVKSFSQIAVTIPKPLHVHFSLPIDFAATVVYPAHTAAYYLSNFHVEIFHPPIV